MAGFRWERNEVRRRMQIRGRESVEGQPLEAEARSRLRSVLTDRAYHEGDPRRPPPEYRPEPKRAKKRLAKRQAASLQVAPSSGRIMARRADDEEPKERQERLRRELEQRARKARDELAGLEKAVQRKREQLATIERRMTALTTSAVTGPPTGSP